ncbi:MAG TPA: hypothetical protein VNH84_20610, partial [Candidatus Saccharimonadales bacterium]|nr:hypothetical protein [Candidatus Saccharimonadales bacterium]
MGNTFLLSLRGFHEHVVETDYFFGATASVCEVGFAGRTKHVAIVSVVWNQPSNGLQVDQAFRSRRNSRPSRSKSSATSSATTSAAVVEPSSAIAPQAPELGQQEAGRGIAPDLFEAKSSVGADNRLLAEAVEPEWSASATVSARAAIGTQGFDGGPQEQPSLDGGFQGLVSDPGRKTSGTVDGSRFVQPLSLDGSAPGKPALG